MLERNIISWQSGIWFAIVEVFNGNSFAAVVAGVIAGVWVVGVFFVVTLVENVCV